MPNTNGDETSASTKTSDSLELNTYYELLLSNPDITAQYILDDIKKESINKDTTPEQEIQRGLTGLKDAIKSVRGKGNATGMTEEKFVKLSELITQDQGPLFQNYRNEIQQVVEALSSSEISQEIGATDIAKIQEILESPEDVDLNNIGSTLSIIRGVTDKLMEENEVGGNLELFEGLRDSFYEFQELIPNQEGMSPEILTEFKKVAEKIDNFILQHEEVVQDVFIISTAETTQKQQETSQASSTQFADSSGPNFHEITEAIRDEILKKQRLELMKSFAAKDTSDNLAFKGDKEFREFLQNPQNAAQISERLADKDLKTLLEKIEVDGYKTVHNRFKDSFKKMDWTDGLAGSTDKTLPSNVKLQIVKGTDGEELCTLNSTTHQSDAQINGDLKVNSYRTIEFPQSLKNDATMHLSLAVQDVNGRNMREPAVFFTAHYEEGKLVEVSSPIPVKFGSGDDNAVGYIERNGTIYTLPVTQKEYKRMMVEVAKNLGQGINNSQVMALESVDNMVVHGVKEAAQLDKKTVEQEQPQSSTLDSTPTSPTTTPTSSLLNDAKGSDKTILPLDTSGVLTATAASGGVNEDKDKELQQPPPSGDIPAPNIVGNASELTATQKVGAPGESIIPPPPPLTSANISNNDPLTSQQKDSSARVIAAPKVSVPGEQITSPAATDKKDAPASPAAGGSSSDVASTSPTTSLSDPLGTADGKKAFIKQFKDNKANRAENVKEVLKAKITLEEKQKIFKDIEQESMIIGQKALLQL